MKTKILLFCLLCLCFGRISLAQDNVKLAQTGFKFLNVSMDPRAVAMGDAVTALEGSSSAIFYNPASLARMSSMFDVTLNRVEWIADISHVSGAVAFSPFNGEYGIAGVSVQAVDYGDIQRTIIADNENGYMDVGTFKPTAIAIGLTYTRALSDRFAVGGNVRYVRQDLGAGVNVMDVNSNPVGSKNMVEVLSFDFGMFYKTGIKSLDFAMCVRNFSKEVKYQREGFQLPLIFKVGAAMNVMDLVTDSKDADKFFVSVDATHPRDYPEQINVGGEYVFMQTLALRAGYMFNNDEYGFTAGAGVQQMVAGVGLGIDYSYTPFGVFGKINRFSVHFSL